MAKITFGSIVSGASGSVGGNVYSRNRYGTYMRRKAIPVNPNTPRQAATRAAFATLSNRWQNILLAGERLAWKTYADNVPMVPSSGGLPVFLTAASMYIRCNMPRLTAGLALVDTGPTTFSLCELTDPTVSLEADSPGDVEVTFTATDEWAIAVGGALLVFASTEKAPTVNFFKGPYQFAGSILGAVVPPTSPAMLAATTDYTAGNNAFVRFIAVAPDGRISNVIRTGGLIT